MMSRPGAGQHRLAVFPDQPAVTGRKHGLRPVEAQFGKEREGGAFPRIVDAALGERYSPQRASAVPVCSAAAAIRVSAAWGASQLPASSAPTGGQVDQW